jgi:hypothetical protein
MSGCGIWSLPEWDDPYSLAMGKLVAIFTDHHRGARLLVGTRIAFHFAIIRSCWPEFDGVLPTLGLPASAV